MQTIPIIISEKELKKIFFEIIGQINKFFTHKYEMIDDFSDKYHGSTTMILDVGSYKNISNKLTINQKFFLINDNSLITTDIKNDRILINYPFKILDLFKTVENNLEQIKKRDQKKIKFNHHIFDPLSRTLNKDKKFIRLTEKESEIFSSLIENKNQYMSKKFLLQKVWRYSQEIDTHTLETHLYSLRKKIDENLGTKNLIMYEEKKGYLINTELL